MIVPAIIVRAPTTPCALNYFAGTSVVPLKRAADGFGPLVRRVLARVLAVDESGAFGRRAGACSGTGPR
jgi:hypothetical protein